MEIMLGSALIVCWLGGSMLPAPHALAPISIPWVVLLLSAVPAIGLATVLSFQHAASRHLANSHYVVFFGLLFPAITLAVVGGGLQNQPHLILAAGALSLVFGPWALAHVIASTDGRPMGAVRLAVLAWVAGWCLCRAIPPVVGIVIAGGVGALWLLRDELLPARVAPSPGIGLGMYLLLNVAALLGPLVVMLSYFYGFYEQMDTVLDAADPLGGVMFLITPESATAGNFWALVGARYVSSFVAMAVLPVAVMLWPQMELGRRAQGLCAGLVVIAAATGGHATVGAGMGAFVFQMIALVVATCALARLPRTARWRQALLAIAAGATVALSAWMPMAPSLGEAFLLWLADSTWMVLLWLPAYFFAIRTVRVEPGSV
jgi:hypothetical protein